MTTNATTIKAKTRIPTIVYVEDNAGDALILRETLSERGHDVELMVIEQGDKALHYFELKSRVADVPPPHCILLDTHLPVVAGAQLLRFLRGSRAYDDTPIYIFAAEATYKDVIQNDTVSKETFITKPESWEGFLDLADLLMNSAAAKHDNLPATNVDSKPEVHAEGALRRQDTQEQRDRTKLGHASENS